MKRRTYLGGAALALVTAGTVYTLRRSQYPLEIVLRNNTAEAEPVLVRLFGDDGVVFEETDTVPTDVKRTYEVTVHESVAYQLLVERSPDANDRAYDLRQLSIGPRRNRVTVTLDDAFPHGLSIAQ